MHFIILLTEVIKMKDDKFKKLSDNETGKISEGGISHETKAMGMKAYENYSPEGDFQKITLLL